MQNLAEALVTLDAALALQPAEGAQPGKACQPPSSVGCAMLAALLQFPKVLRLLLTGSRHLCGYGSGTMRMQAWMYQALAA